MLVVVGLLELADQDGPVGAVHALAPGLVDQDDGPGGVMLVDVRLHDLADLVGLRLVLVSLGHRVQMVERRLLAGKVCRSQRFLGLSSPPMVEPRRGSPF